MQKVLFHSTIFGPIKSRRLGVSLGVNLTPNDGKICSFDCLYCEAGLNAQGTGTTGFPSVEKVSRELKEKLKAMKENGEQLDVITFSGNGEPTLHPRFPEIINKVKEIRDKFYPEAKISVLTNSTRIDRSEIVEALRSIDNPILKLDSAIDSTIKLIDRPNSPDFTAKKVIEWLEGFGPSAIVQTMLLTGEHNGKIIDNTTDEEVEALIKAIEKIKPREVMLYSIDRPTPITTLKSVPREKIEVVAEKLRHKGIKVSTV